jgi:DNA/RNA endonuclease YhcR with UshA esterase domain
MMRFLSAFVVLFGHLLIFAEEPAQAKDQAPPLGSAENAEWLQKNLQREVVIRGVVSDQSSIAQAGHFFYLFERSELKLFCFQGAAVTIPEEKHPTSLVGKTIEVRGKLALYKDKPQIVIRQQEQIQVIASAEVQKPAVEKSDQPQAKGKE